MILVPDPDASVGGNIIFILCKFYCIILLGRICSDISEYEEFEKLFKDLSLKDKDFIEDSSGCLYPCDYLEYRCCGFSFVRF